MQPTLADIEATVERLEAWPPQSSHPGTRHLFDNYRKLDARFQPDSPIRATSLLMRRADADQADRGHALRGIAQAERGTWQLATCLAR